MDSSRVSTFLISILLIVYGSFRSLNMEQEAREREKEKERTNLLSGIVSTAGSDCGNSGGVQTLETMHALCLPLGASVSLLIMFFFFDSMQMLFAICTASESVSNDLSTRIPWNLYSTLYSLSCFSHSNSRAGLPAATYVPVHNSPMFRR